MFSRKAKPAATMLAGLDIDKALVSDLANKAVNDIVAPAKRAAELLSRNEDKAALLVLCAVALLAGAVGPLLMARRAEWTPEEAEKEIARLGELLSEQMRKNARPMARGEGGVFF